MTKKDGITNKELLDYLCYPVLYRVEELEGKCKHCGEKTNPAYCDITKAIYGKDIALMSLAVSRTLYILEEKG